MVISMLTKQWKIWWVYYKLSKKWFLYIFFLIYFCPNTKINVLNQNFFYNKIFVQNGFYFCFICFLLFLIISDTRIMIIIFTLLLYFYGNLKNEQFFYFFLFFFNKNELFNTNTKMNFLLLCVITKSSFLFIYILVYLLSYIFFHRVYIFVV